MNRFLVLAALALGAASLAAPALAELDVAGDSPAMLMNARVAQEMRTRVARPGVSGYATSETTWVGYNPAYAGSNYWSIGVGNRRPRGTTGPGKGDIVPVPDEDTGYWDWDHPVHGDSLQGWWPVRRNYTGFAPNISDVDRPWFAIEIGNQISYVINQGPGRRRTFGVTSAWHVDPGVNAKVTDPAQADVNPNPPRWAPLAGSRSAWCGLRAHGDVTAVDALTGNPYNVDALEWVQHARLNTPNFPSGTGHRFPGYAGQWDQMLFRDIDISDTTVALGSANVSVSFRYRTRMSTGKSISPNSQTGWFDKDPLAVVAGNFISATNAGTANSPIDSFMVYVGSPVADTVGAEWTGSDGLTHAVFDPVRRWFGELIRANDAGGHYQLFTAYGNRPPIVSPADSNGFVDQIATRNVTYGQLRAAWGNRIRLVFRVKTNRGSETSSDDCRGSVVGAYTSGYLGAAQVDEVAVNLGGGTMALGDFESDGDIDNRSEASALDKWKTSSKPPAHALHVHDLSSLAYEDLCGPPGSPNRACNLAGNVISMGDHDLGEAASGSIGAERESFQAIFSPTINLAFDPGNPTARNNMGLDADTAVPTADFILGYEIYAGWFDLSHTGQGWNLYIQSYPAAQSDGTRMWGDPRITNTGPFFSPQKECFSTGWESSGAMVQTINPNGIPDSIRIGFVRQSQCLRFGLPLNCGGADGGYLDNFSLGLVDGPALPPLIFAEPWDFWQDAFPANETAGLPGTAAFDTTTALIKSAMNIADVNTPTHYTHYIVPADTLAIYAPGDSVEVQLVFRIRPGPGNYVVPGDPCSGLRRVATDSTRITPGDGTFWSEFIENPGKDKDAFPVTGDCKGGGTLRHDQRWSELTWCNARMDTAEANMFAIQGRSIGGPDPGTYATMYHEDDKHLAALGIPRHECFLVDPAGPVNMTNITCSGVPAWVSAPGTGYDGSPTTVEGTKILPDGLLTPGSHVQYFYVKKDLTTGYISMLPDTSVVYPQSMGLYYTDLDSHRWQQFSVLPDAWKFAAYGGLGKACLLYVDWADSYGEERAWVSVADSIGATAASSRGAHNGWSAPGGADINDPAHFVNKNAQPGTSWDMYGVKSPYGYSAGTIGSRLSNRTPGTLVDDKWAKNAPTPEMMAAYYRILMILSGNIFQGYITGPIEYRGADDTEFIRLFVTGATAETHRGLWCMGADYVSDLDYNTNTTLLDVLGVSLRDTRYLAFSSTGTRTCVDLIPTAPITTSGDIYGLRNSCYDGHDVLESVGDAVPASYYDPAGANPLNAPYVAGVFRDADANANPPRYYQSLVDGFTLESLRSRLCDTSAGRLAYAWNVFNNVFGKICAVAGAPPVTLDVPGNADGGAFVNLAGLGNNPLRAGHAVIHLSLAQADRVTVKIYDVSGRLVRTLADGQLFKAGRVDPALTWDGLDNGGRGVARGAYFVNVRYEKSRFETARKMIVLR